MLAERHGGQRRGVRKRLVVVPDEPLEKGDSVRPNDKLAMVGAEVSCNRGRMRTFVISGLVKANRECLDRTAVLAAHQGHNDTGIYTTTEQRPEGHIAN